MDRADRRVAVSARSMVAVAPGDTGCDDGVVSSGSVAVSAGVGRQMRNVASTTAIGHVWRSPRSPSTRKTRMNGTTIATNGVWRPAICDSVWRSMPVTELSVMMGAAVRLRRR